MTVLKLNIGCGNCKIKGYVNIDGEKGCKPDLVLDVTRHSLPYKAGTVDEILLFHTIEHVRKKLHGRLLLEFNRVLKPNGKLLISYPNFWECAQRWHENSKGQRNFWEATLYGRQLYPSDYHVCAMNPDELALLLCECGFGEVKSFPEPDESYNTVTTCLKIRNGSIPTYESVVAQDMKTLRTDLIIAGRRSK